jgi:hypothetical protein
MFNLSILTKPKVDKMLEVARQNVEQDGSLQPVLFLQLAGREVLHMPLSLPDTFEEKARYFLGVNFHLHKLGLTLRAAVFCAETWFVNAQNAPAAMKVPPSEHPARQEAIVAIGRSADNQRHTLVIQPFTRDKLNRPLWLPLPLAQYDEARTNQNRAYGILDCLFEAIPGSS